MLGRMRTLENPPLPADIRNQLLLTGEKCEKESLQQKFLTYRQDFKKLLGDFNE